MVTHLCNPDKDSNTLWLSRSEDIMEWVTGPKAFRGVANISGENLLHPSPIDTTALAMVICHLSKIVIFI